MPRGITISSCSTSSKFPNHAISRMDTTSRLHGPIRPQTSSNNHTTSTGSPPRRSNSKTCKSPISTTRS
ncbi:Protein of unknown function [Pyronema omphalodes CBS 100304]|uniref:Uncharacterized protein n=1 Tax=Pyronema omphalodes (strain CBS 100304) TaxID=1076935 RepID=U4L2F3_PYROM|nr:Protein of unknown function [Pyronema omphalodes CBS 100304]